MAQVRQDKDGFYVSTTFSYHPVKAIPEIGLPEIPRVHSATSSVTSGTSTTPSQKLAASHIPPYEPCFVTKRPGYTLEKAHLVNAARKDRARKEAIEVFLLSCNVVGPAFRLDSAPNMIPLDRTLHTTLDFYGFIAITCSKESLRKILDEVQRANSDWDAEDGGVPRLFKLTQPPFSDATYDLVVLHPDHFLPKGSAITVHSGDPLTGKRLGWKAYVVASDGALREGYEPTSQRLPAFSALQLRKASNSVNPLLVVTNAAMAFRRYQRIKDGLPKRLCAEYQELVDLTIELAKALYYHPIAKTAGERYLRLCPPKGPKDQGDHGSQSDPDGDSDMTDEFGRIIGPGGEDKDKTITPKKNKGGSATSGKKRQTFKASADIPGKELGPDTPNNDFLDFCFSILSDGDHHIDPSTLPDLYSGVDDVEDEDEDTDSDDGDDNEDDRGRQAIPQGVADKISQWRSAVPIAASG